MINQLVLKNRSYRRFYEDDAIERDTLEIWVNLARLSPSAANLQPLRFFLSHQSDTNHIIFPKLSWAGYLKDWPGPSDGERPAAYIIILADTNSPKPAEFDTGIAAQSILLGAVEAGYGGCIVGSVKKDELATALSIPKNLKIMLVLALGKPREKVVIEDMQDNEDIHYWRDANNIHHVPKRKLSDLIINPDKP
ncbi:MAG: nitroreductase family protein [Bacteroidota bacterium]|nr:nitroreductase family protein [Bacteroidota bacterium]